MVIVKDEDQVDGALDHAADLVLRLVCTTLTLHKSRVMIK